MILILLLILIIIIASSKITEEGNNDYLSRSQTKTINGIFILLIFMSHFSQYVNLCGVLNTTYLAFRKAMSQYVVTTFLFYSGYGILCSINSKGSKYVNKIPINRILKTLVIFDIAIIFYVLLNIAIGTKMTISQILLSLIGWDSVGNSSWYMFAICCMYLITYIGFKISKDKNKIQGLIITTILALVYYFLMKQFKEARYYNSVLCYVLGSWYFYFKPQIDKTLKRKVPYLATLTACIILFLLFVFYREKNIIFNQTAYFLFVIIIVLFTMKVKISNRIFLWCGQNLFGLFILQRLPMIAFQQSNWMINNLYIYFVVCLVFTFLFVLLFQKCIVKNIEKVFARLS